MTTTYQQDAARYAKRNREHRVYVIADSSQGYHVWLVRQGKNPLCVSGSFGGRSRPTKRQFSEFCASEDIEAGTTVVLFGTRGGNMRVTA